jgi:hypothetical protein
MTSRTGDVQIETLEFILLEDLSWDITVGEPNELLFKTFPVRLWAYWAVTGCINYRGV